MLTGICCPLVGLDTGTLVVAGAPMPGPVICTSMVAISSTDWAHAGGVLGNHRWIHATRRDERDCCCACRASTINDKFTATICPFELSEPHAKSDAMSKRASVN